MSGSMWLESDGLSRARFAQATRPRSVTGRASQGIAGLSGPLEALNQCEPRWGSLLASRGGVCRCSQGALG